MTTVSMHMTIFGTDGIRAAFGSPPLCTPHLEHIGYAVGSWFTAAHGHAPTCFMLHDGRASSADLMHHVTQGLAATEARVICGGLLPTAAATWLLDELAADIGIIISASHNAATDNGIKLVMRHGKLTMHAEQMITIAYHETSVRTHAYRIPVIQYLNDARERYINHLIRFAPTTRAQKTIVIDCAYGAASVIIPRLAQQCNVTILPLNHQPSGNNINERCGSTHIEALRHEVARTSAAYGLAFDGDGDRVLCVTKDGHVRDGDDIVWLLASSPAYRGTRHIVGTIMSNEGLAHALQERNVTLVRAPVGDRNVAQEMENLNVALGGEPSGHIILRDILATGDGILTALRIIDELARTGNDAFDTFTHMPQSQLSIRVTHKLPLEDPHITELIDQSMRHVLPGRIVVRYSGTEPVLRIMVEAESEILAHTTCRTLAHSIAQRIQSP